MKSNIKIFKSNSCKLKLLSSFVALLMTVFLFSCKDKNPPEPKVETPANTVNLTFKFTSFIGSYFISNASDTVKIAKLKYIFSNFILEKTSGEFVKVPDAYGYISMLDGLDSFVITKVPKGDYKSIRLEIGLDSAINHGAPQQWGLTHPLNPSVTDMYWSWNGGYIFNVIEGYYKNNGFEKAFSFHIALDKNVRKYSFVTNYSITKNSKFIMSLNTEKYFSSVVDFSLKKDGDFSHSGDPDPVMDKFMQNVTSVLDFTSFQ